MSPVLPGMFFTTEPPGQDTEKLSMDFFVPQWRQTREKEVIVALNVRLLQELVMVVVEG